MIQVDFLYWEDCPSHEQALALLKTAISEEGVAAEISIQDIETDEDAERLRFPGSPTIRVNGTDIQPEVDDSVSGLTCRAYRTASGKIGPLPPKSLIVDALRAATRARESQAS